MERENTRTPTITPVLEIQIPPVPEEQQEIQYSLGELWRESRVFRILVGLIALMAFAIVIVSGLVLGSRLKSEVAVEVIEVNTWKEFLFQSIPARDPYFSLKKTTLETQNKNGVQFMSTNNQTNSIFSTSTDYINLPPGCRNLMMKAARVDWIKTSDQAIRIKSGSFTNLLGSKGTNLFGKTSMEWIAKDIFLESVTGDVKIYPKKGITLNITDIPLVFSDGRKGDSRLLNENQALMLCSCENSSLFLVADSTRNSTKRFVSCHTFANSMC